MSAQMDGGAEANARPDHEAIQDAADAPPGEWYYSYCGSPEGPISTARLRELLAEGTIDADTYVLRADVDEWVAIRDANILPDIETKPPPLAAHSIGNELVWLVAFMPLLYAFVFGAIPQKNQIPWIIPAMVSPVLCLFDVWRLKKAGYSTNALLFCAVFLVPVYLFERAKRLKQTASYGGVWIICVVLALLA